jgi:hypothetical protein
MTLPRVTAAIFVALLIGCLAFVCVSGVVVFAATSTASIGGIQESDVGHDAGTIIAIGPGKDFILETAAGHKVYFQCEDQCRATLAHLQRHRLEHAHTDVYYNLKVIGSALLAVDVD